MTEEQKTKLFKTEDVGFYLIIWNEIKAKWELRRKLTGTNRTLFIKSCEYKTPLLLAVRKLQGLQ